MKPSVNIDAAVIAKVTKRVKIAMLGNVIAVNDPVKMAEEIAMLTASPPGPAEETPKRNCPYSDHLVFSTYFRDSPPKLVSVHTR